MIGRRGVIAATLLSGVILASPAAACRAPRAKDRRGYRAAIDSLFAAWWTRDYAAFQRLFEHVGVPEPFHARPLFEAHFATPERRLRGALLFNGPSVVTQIVTPRGPDPVHGFCGGSASADLFLVKFFPGVETPVMERVDHLDSDLLAASEWDEMQD